METSELVRLANQALGDGYIAKPMMILPDVITVDKMDKGKPKPVATIRPVTGVDGTVHVNIIEPLTLEDTAAAHRIASQYHAAGLMVIGVDVPPYGFH